jgi:hypothetical protein
MKNHQAYRYELSLVSYIDLLGMRALLQQAGEDPSIVAAILDGFRQFSEPDEPSIDTWEWKFVNFSDLVVRSVPVLSNNNKKYRLGLVFHELKALAQIQANLANRKVLLRGGVTMGNIAINAGLVFGPALVKGYELEKTQARFPRIVIDEVVFREMRENPLLSAHDYEDEMRYIRRLVRQDADNLNFVDYLGCMLHNADDIKDRLQLLIAHRELAQEQLANAGKLDPSSRERRSHLEKARWLADYHNSHVDALTEETLGTPRSVLYVSGIASIE